MLDNQVLRIVLRRFWRAVWTNQSSSYPLTGFQPGYASGLRKVRAYSKHKFWKGWARSFIGLLVILRQRLKMAPVRFIVDCWVAATNLKDKGNFKI